MCCRSPLGFRVVLCLNAALAVTLAGGCDPPPRPPVAGETNDALVKELDAISAPPPEAVRGGDAAVAGAAAEQNDLPADEAANNAAGGPQPVGPQAGQRTPWEAWDAYYMAGEHIGYSHVRAESQPGGRTVLHMHDRMTLRRGEQTLTNEVTHRCVQDARGRLQSFEAETHSGTDVTRVEGTRSEGELRMERIRGDERSTDTIAWKEHYWGLLGVQQSLRQQPLAVGQRRRIEALLPVQYRIGRYDLRATAEVAVPMLGGQSQRLTEIHSRLQLAGGAELESYLWIDSQGHTLKAYTPAMDLTAYRTDQATATATASPTKDVLDIGTIPLTGRVPLASPEKASQVTFRLTMATGAAVPRLEPAAGQRLQPAEDQQSLLITVRAGLDRNAPLPPVEDSDTAAGPVIDHQDPRLARMVQALEAGPERSPREKVLQATGFVHQYIRRKDLSQGFATASQVAREGQGDCTEHAVLLAAILRRMDIPTRLVAGLTYVTRDGQAVMMYHMWNVARVDEGWLPVDATLGGLAPASRIALVTTNLASGNEYECLDPIFSVIGRIELEIVSAQ